MLFTKEQAENIKAEYSLIVGHRFDINGKRLSIVNFVLEERGDRKYEVLVCFEAVNNKMTVIPIIEFLQEANIPFDIEDY